MKKRVVPVPPKDGILAHLLRKYPNMIFNYHEHDSLLANKEDEELNEREKTEAWQKCQKQNLQSNSTRRLFWSIFGIINSISSASAQFLYAQRTGNCHAVQIE